MRSKQDGGSTTTREGGSAHPNAGPKKQGSPRNSATLERHNADPDARAKVKAIFLLTFRRPASVLAASEAAGVDRSGYGHSTAGYRQRL